MNCPSWCQSVFYLTMHLEIIYRQLSFVTRWTCECWIFVKSECLNCFTQGVHTPKNSCFDSWSTNSPDVSTDRYCGVCSTSLRTILNSRSCAWSFIGLGGVNTRMFDLLATGFCAIRIYHKNATVYVPDELGMLQCISKWTKTTNHPWCCHVLSLHDSFELKSTSTDGRHIWFAHQV